MHLQNKYRLGIGYKKRFSMPFLVMCEANSRILWYQRPLVMSMLMFCSILVSFSFCIVELSFGFRFVAHYPHAPHVY